MATCFPASGRSVQRPALMAWASASTEPNSAGSRSAISRKSLPRRLTTCTDHDAPIDRLEAGLDQLPRDDGRDREVAGRIELRQPRAQPGVVSQPKDEVAAGRGLEAELGGPESERRFVAEADREAVGDTDLWPRVGVRKRDGFHGVPQRPHLMAPLDDHDAIAEEAEPARRPGMKLDPGPDRDRPRSDRSGAESDARHPAFGQAGGHDGEEAEHDRAEEAGGTKSHDRPARPDVDHGATPTKA